MMSVSLSGDWKETSYKGFSGGILIPKQIAIIDDDEAMLRFTARPDGSGWSGRTVLWIRGRLPRIRFAPSSRVPDN